MNASPTVFVDGAYVAREDARISIFDRGFLFGDSIYETVRTRGGKVLFWRDHLERLRRSAALLEIDLGEHGRDPLPILRELIARNELDSARLRVVVSRGVGGRDQVDGFTPTWVVIPEPFEPLSDDAYARGIVAVLVHVRRNAATSLNPEIKSGNLLNNVLARREAVRVGAAEGVLVNQQGYLAEGALSNLFWVGTSGELFTPALDVGILPGITREKILRVAREAGRPVHEVRERPEALDQAAEIFMTSTSWEALAVTTWNGHRVGTGGEGSVTRSMRARLRSLYEMPEEVA